MLVRDLTIQLKIGMCTAILLPALHWVEDSLISVIIAMSCIIQHRIFRDTMMICVAIPDGNRLWLLMYNRHCLLGSRKLDGRIACR